MKPNNPWLPLAILAVALVLWAGLFAAGAYPGTWRRSAPPRLRKPLIIMGSMAHLPFAMGIRPLESGAGSEANRMHKYPSDIAFTPAVKAIQAAKGFPRSRTPKSKAAKAGRRPSPTSWPNFWPSAMSSISPRPTRQGSHTCNIGAAGPASCTVIDKHTLGFADFDGNQQYITLGNLSENPKAFIFLMDYIDLRRVKIWGTARVVEDDPALVERLRDPSRPAPAERAIVFEIEAWDMNCHQHIHRRLPQEIVAAVTWKSCRGGFGSWRRS